MQRLLGKKKVLLGGFDTAHAPSRYLYIILWDLVLYMNQL
ncbi:unnamed protein product [Brassica oleracea]